MEYEWPDIPRPVSGATATGDLERSAIAVIIVFGAVIICGLMAATLVNGQKDGFLFALGSATTAWLAGHAMMFDWPRVYGVLIVVSVLLAGGATLTLIT